MQGPTTPNGVNLLAACLVGTLCAGCADEIRTDPTPTVVNVTLSTKEAPNSRRLTDIQWNAVTLRPGASETLEIHVSATYTTQLEEWRDWFLSYGREEHIGANLYLCPLMIAMSPVGAVLDSPSNTARDTKNTCVGGTKAMDPDVRHAPDAPQRTGKVSTQAERVDYSGPLTIQIDQQAAITAYAQNGLALVPLNEPAYKHARTGVNLVVRSAENDSLPAYTASLSQLRKAAAQEERAQKQTAQAIALANAQQQRVEKRVEQARQLASAQPQRTQRVAEVDSTLANAQQQQQAQQQAELDRQMASLQQQINAAQEAAAMPDAEEEEPEQAPRTDPDANLRGTFVQAYTQMRTGNSELAAQAGRAAGEDEDTAEANTEQVNRNQQTQQAAQERIQELQAQREALQARREELQRQQAQLLRQQAQLQQDTSTPASARAQPSTAQTVWPVPTKQWCQANPGSGNPNCASTTVASANPSGGPQFAPELNRSSCVHEVVMDYGRAIRNDCTVPVNIAYCSTGPVNDGANCAAMTGPVGTYYAVTTVNSLRAGGVASNPSVLSRENHMAFFACANQDGKVQAFLTSYSPPKGACARYN
jgi:hypothetical protein